VTVPATAGLAPQLYLPLLDCHGHCCPEPQTIGADKNRCGLQFLWQVPAPLLAPVPAAVVVSFARPSTIPRRHPKSCSILEHSLEVVELARPLIEAVYRRDRDLALQLRRAISSVALNLAEGFGFCALCEGSSFGAAQLAGVRCQYSNGPNSSCLAEVEVQHSAQSFLVGLAAWPLHLPLGK